MGRYLRAARPLLKTAEGFAAAMQVGNAWSSQRALADRSRCRGQSRSATVGNRCAGVGHLQLAQTRGADHRRWRLRLSCDVGRGRSKGACRFAGMRERAISVRAQSREGDAKALPTHEPPALTLTVLRTVTWRQAGLTRSQRVRHLGRVVRQVPVVARRRARLAQRQRRVCAPSFIDKGSSGRGVTVRPTFSKTGKALRSATRK